VVRARIQADAHSVIARDRVARGLVTPEMNRIATGLEQNWKITLPDLRHWPGRPEQRLEHWVPAGLEAESTVPPCPYQRHRLALVTLEIDRDGALVSVDVVPPSGSRRADREAVDLIRRSAPFPAPNPRDLDAHGISRSVWDIGARDYSLSSCRYIGGQDLVKDIVLVEGS